MIFHIVAPKKSFTLIEMLIVIVIIGILAAALIPRLQSVQGRARDTKRKADMTQINNGLTIYSNDYGYIPHTSRYSGQIIEYASRAAWDYSATGAFLPFLMSGGIMTSVPVDPINNTTVHAPTTGMYSYRYYCYEPSINGVWMTGYGPHLGYYKESPTTWTAINYKAGDELVNPAPYSANWADGNYKCR